MKFPCFNLPLGTLGSVGLKFISPAKTLDFFIWYRRIFIWYAIVLSGMQEMHRPSGLISQTEGTVQLHDNYTHNVIRMFTFSINAWMQLSWYNFIALWLPLHAVCF